FNGGLGGPIGPTNQFTITGTPFSYDPSHGNLLMTVTKDGDGLDFSVFLDFESNAPAGTFSRAYGFGTSGVADFLENDTGLVTQFSSVPEPASLALAAAGLLLLLGSRKFLR